jgi:phenylacetate-CoA ligase
MLSLRWSRDVLVMKLDYSAYPIRAGAYSGRPMSFLDTGPSTILTAVSELALIETGARVARERWQKTQLQNLLTFVTQRSNFWRQRIGGKPRETRLDSLPLLTRNDLKQQVAQEGSLLRPADGMGSNPHATSGSSGTPVHFHISQMNVQYNGARYIAQNFIEGKDLSLNKTRLSSAKTDAANEIAAIPAGFKVAKQSAWLGELGAIFACGPLKHIDCLNPVPRELIRELRRDPVGQLVANPRMVRLITGHSGPDVFKELRVSEWIAYGEEVDRDLYESIRKLGIPILSNYSAEEVGPIAFECPAAMGHFHVATSNVIVEVSDTKYELDGQRLGRVLVTHLHSYATPVIRYDLGDLALLKQRCPCGHDGPAIYSLHGRITNAIKTRDGKYSAFFVRGPELLKRANFSEFRIRQVGFDEIVVELGGRNELSAEEISEVTSFVKTRAGETFEVRILPRETIDWGESVKRQSFRCEI